MNALLLARARAPFFSLSGDDRNGNPGNLQQRQNPQGKLAVLFAEDQFKPKSWLTLNGGLRFSHFHGSNVSVFH